MMTLAHNKYVPHDAFWGERNMFEWYLGTALEMQGAQVPRILLLASLAKCRAYGSSVYTEYERQALRLLQEEESPTSVFYRLSPLLFKVFGMDEEFRARKAELATHADPLYRQWLESLSVEQVMRG